MPTPDEQRYAPSVFMSDYDLPNTVVNTPLPRGTEGGLIENVKRAVTTSVREAVHNTSMTVDEDIYVDIEYPMKEVHYPGIWVQFSVTSLKRAGIDHEDWVQDDSGAWCPVQEFEVLGRVTLTVVALKNKDRDRLADMVISMLAFSRPPNLVVTDPSRDARQHRALKTTLAENPYIAMTINTDVLHPSGQTVNVGVPWQPDVLAYEDGYAFDLIGHFNVMFRHDGTYTLRSIEVADHHIDSVPEPQATSLWRGARPGYML